MGFEVGIPIDQITDGTPITYGVVKPGPEDGSGVKFIRGGDVVGGKIRVKELRTITHDVSAQYRRTLLKGGELLVSLVGNPGEVAVVPAELSGCNIARQVGLIRIDTSKFNPWFVQYYLMSPLGKAQLFAYSMGSVQKVINLKELKRVEIPDVPLGVQNKIVKHLRDLDDKIELNRQTNQTLEAIAQAMFKSWFVDFKPTRAKIKAVEDGQDPTRAAMAAIAGKTIDQLDTLSAEQIKSLTTSAALFPDAFEPSALGEIPEGWEAGELNDIAKFPTGRVDLSNLSQETYISTENMLENKRGITSASSLPAVKTVPNFDAGHILISNIRPYFMKIWLACFQGGRSNDVLGFEAKEEGGTEYLYNLLYQDKFFEFMMTTSKGAKMPRGDKDAIMGWSCVHPKLDIKKAYSSLVRVFYQDIEARNVENRSLEQLRDTLLPQLLSGEIELSEAS
ncbi:restriction endonuclease subunit S [Octadecabacter sp. 1_MG-2023]|uniref:restriction endonuclease subunit S n=1 Tax=unclassified Octadecabacter TaxID=196158 RepID=UPI001C07F9F2|nr:MULTISPECIES: restriction endonuclease subunit S [unclassified Octadecabacter]MBU2994112.1 restriction endonuclease subunit S [Octadecabacter sp. B2R22]MDO6734599.1 restriction endonuclease subunit S [Octadecabacter sp. 1_MG-2023]